MPEQDAVLAMTSGARDMQAILDAAWSTLLPAMGDGVKVVGRRQRELKKTLRSLRLEPAPFVDDVEAAAAIDGRTYELADNEAGLRTIGFSLARRKLVVKLRDRRTSTYRCGAGRWAPGKARLEDSRDPSRHPVRCAYTWTGRGVLEITIRTITTPFCGRVRCRFAGDQVEVTLSRNVSFGPTELGPIAGRRV
jgi:hypothetical protein